MQQNRKLIAATGLMVSVSLALIAAGHPRVGEIILLATVFGLAVRQCRTHRKNILLRNDLKITKETIDGMAKVADFGIWTLDLKTNEVTWTEQLGNILKKACWPAFTLLTSRKFRTKFPMP
jgi:hypothetical protein